LTLHRDDSGFGIEIALEHAAQSGTSRTPVSTGPVNQRIVGECRQIVRIASSSKQTAWKLRPRNDRHSSAPNKRISQLDEISVSDL
jgi:hypothetical protein